MRAYSAPLVFGVGAHRLRAAAAINALDHQPHIATMQGWLGALHDRATETARRQPDV
nr:hypothetical protein [uncultured Rhodopila sp.]